MNWGRGLPALLACLVGATFVAACDAHSKPSAVPTLASSSSAAAAATHAPASPRASSTPASPTATDKASLESAYPSAVAQEGAAVQVVRDFFDGMNYQIDTGSETKVYKTFNQDCTKCLTGVAAIQQLFEGGHKIRGGHFHLTGVNSVYPTAPDIIAVLVTDSQDSGEQTDASGEVTHKFDAAPRTQILFYVLLDRPTPVIQGAIYEGRTS